MKVLTINCWFSHCKVFTRKNRFQQVKSKISFKNTKYNKFKEMLKHAPYKMAQIRTYKTDKKTAIKEDVRRKEEFCFFAVGFVQSTTARDFDEIFASSATAPSRIQ